MGVIVRGMETDLERLTRDYWCLVQRIRRLPMPEPARLLILADVAAIYRAEVRRIRSLDSVQIP